MYIDHWHSRTDAIAATIDNSVGKLLTLTQWHARACREWNVIYIIWLLLCRIYILIL